MSTYRGTIAEALGVKEEDIICENCPSSREFLSDTLICDFHDLCTPKDGFCPFWGKEDEK